MLARCLRLHISGRHHPSQDRGLEKINQSVGARVLCTVPQKNDPVLVVALSFRSRPIDPTAPTASALGT